MNTRFSRFSSPNAMLLAIGLGLAFGCSQTANAQEGQQPTEGIKIQIVNQDGESVAPVEIQAAEGGQIQGQASAKVTLSSGGKIEAQDGKIVIVNADGTKQEIDVRGAKSVIVNQGVKAIMQDGEEKTETFGKAIIIGPDGKRQEIILGNPLPGQINMKGLGKDFSGTFQFDRINNKFMIGVNCEPVDEGLAAQLKLEPGTGLIAKTVTPDSPAQKAGIQIHDIMMYADDTQLTKQSDLVEAVQTAGQEKTKLSLTIIRAGKEIGVDVEPVERPASAIQSNLPQMLKVFPELNGHELQLKVQQMGPGVIVDQFDEDFQRQIEIQMNAVRAQMDELKKQMEQYESDK